MRDYLFEMGFGDLPNDCDNPNFVNAFDKGKWIDLGWI